MTRTPHPPALMTDADLRRWFRGLGLVPARWPRLHRLDVPVSFTTPQGDHWTITPLITGAFLVAPGLPQPPDDPHPDERYAGEGDAGRGAVQTTGEHLRPQLAGQPRPKAWDVPRRLRGVWLSQARRRPKPCEYGHVDCSAIEGGFCSDELRHLIDAEHETRRR